MRQLLSSVLLLCLLVAPLAAQQEALHGTWEGTIVDEQIGEIAIRLTFEEDGAFEINQVIQVKDDFLADVQVPEPPIIETIVAHGTGTYGILFDGILVSITALDISVDGKDFVEFFTQVARDFARYVADSHEIPAENYPAFEQEFIDAFFAELDKVQFLAVLNEWGVSAYALEGDTLILTTTRETGVTIWELHPVDESSAIAETTWGSLKAAWRR
ncbi:MAG: hypothetical protein F4Z85_00580 [Gemmatimonadetes bacterium]|nr:hypothetical protein [Gemmatimonadota bacterium]MYB69440.1 hypothetical protein [Gemmatimonadota bacterium]